MRTNYQKLFERIIFAIKREQELRRTRKLLFGFLSLAIISLIATPVAVVLFVNQIESSGISYFISAALGDMKTFSVLWQDFGLAILESLPLAAILAFIMSFGIAVFTLRLFLHKKRLLLGYLINNFA